MMKRTCLVAFIFLLQTVNSRFHTTTNSEECERVPTNFISKASQKAGFGPAVLTSIPGSGNTWTRLLLEQITGFYTGSAYNDSLIKPILRGEGICNASTLAIKAHPHHFEVTKDGRILLSDIKKCRKYNMLFIQRAIIVTRDPFDAILAETKRQLGTTRRADVDSHSADIILSTHNEAAWRGIVMNQAVKVNIGTQRFIQIMKTFNATNYLVIRYEDLLDKSIRAVKLDSMVAFLGYPPVHPSAIKCAFALADSPSIHRPRGNTSSTLQSTLAMDPKLVCKIWETGARIFSDQFRYFNPIMKNLSCRAQ